MVTWLSSVIVKLIFPWTKRTYFFIDFLWFSFTCLHGYIFLDNFFYIYRLRDTSTYVCIGKYVRAYIYFLFNTNIISKGIKIAQLRT